MHSDTRKTAPGLQEVINFLHLIIMKGIFIFLLICSTACYSQPYIDLAKINYAYTPAKGIGEKTDPITCHYYSANITLPLEIKKGRDAIIINPFIEHYKGELNSGPFHVSSTGAALAFLKKNKSKKWSLLSTFIIRQNKATQAKPDESWQYGGAFIAAWQKKESLSLKFGLYYNREFFGNFFVPLVGIDWHITDNNNLFGVLPGNLTYEHRFSKNIWSGFVFRSITNSYRLPLVDPCFSGDCSGKNYLRINDNQLGIFADMQLFSKFILNVETGYTILRNYRLGFRGNNADQQSDHKSDNFYFRTMLAYRLRLH
jgi:hypothetical protein